MISLIDHLQAKFLERHGKTEGPLAAADFVEFAKNYLAQYRPAAIDHKCEMNYIVTLQDGATVLIAPEYDRRSPTGAGRGSLPAYRQGDMAGGSPSVSLTPENLRTGRSLDDGTSVNL